MVVPFAILGLVLGAFLNPVIDRVPLQRTLLGAPDCRHCRRRYNIVDFLAILRVPLRGFLCPACGAPVFARSLAVEILTAGLLAFLWLKFGTTLLFALTALYSTTFIILFFIDIEHMRVPNVIVLPAVILAVGTSIFQPGLFPALIGGAFGFGVLILLYQISPKSIGAGDVKLAGLIGLLVGWPGIIVGLLLGFVLGGVTALILLVSGGVGRKSYIPYAPFLIVGAIVAMLYGNEVILWYVSRYH